jgi:hypothetical protein
MNITRHEHDRALELCSNKNATEDEKRFLSWFASMYAANERVSKNDIMRFNHLSGSSLNPTANPIDERG